MSGGLSSHLLGAYSNFKPSQAPFGQPFHPSQIAVSGAMSFNPNMHGTFTSQPSFIDPNLSSSFLETSESTAMKIAELQAKLDKKLGPEYISQRPGPGGGPKLTYAEGWKIINLANEVFGFNGWSSSVVNLNVDYVDFNEESKRYNVGCSAIMRVTLRDGVFHEDLGYGTLENSRSKGAAIDKCKKEAVTDALKRALRNFGNLMGNCLYDKHYTQEVVKIKLPPAKFDKDKLHRRPEFDESKIASTSSSTLVSTSPISLPKAGSMSTPMKIEAFPSALPPHMRPIVTSTPNGKSGVVLQSPKALSTPSSSGVGLGLHAASSKGTPIQKPSAPPIKNAAPVGQKQNTPSSDPQTPTHDSHAPGRMLNSDQDTNSRNEQLQRSRSNRDQLIQQALKEQQQETSAPITAQNSPQISKAALNLPTIETNHSTNHPEVQEQDSFHISSEDDAFLAQVDLLDGSGMQVDAYEADLGRPIEHEEVVDRANMYDEGIGQDLDFDLRRNDGGEIRPPIMLDKRSVAGNSNSTTADQAHRTSSHARVRFASPAMNHTPNPHTSRPTVHLPNQPAAPQRPTIPLSNHNQPLSMMPPGPMSRQTHQPPTRQVPPNVQIGSRPTSVAQPARQLTHSTSRENISLSSSTDGPSGGQQLSRPPPNFANSSTNTNQNQAHAQKPMSLRAVSMGGFRFPTGASPNLTSSSIQAQNLANAGLKRNIDAVHGLPSNMTNAFNRPQLSNEGKSNEVTANSSRARQPLATLSLEGSDIKRQRR